MTQDARASMRGTWLEIGAVTVLAALLRLATLGWQSYEFDEGATLYVLRGSFTHMLHAVARYESTPPVYYVLAWLWMQVFGTGEAGLRLLSGTAGVATVPVVYAVGRALASRHVGLVAAVIVATSPYLVFYSQEARAYALFLLLSTVGLLLCVRAMRNPSWRTVAAWAAVSFAAFATHYFAVFPWLGQLIALAVFGVPRRLLAWSVGAVGLASAPLLLLANHQASHGSVDWISAASLAQRVRVAVETFSLGATFKGSLSHPVLALCGFFAVAIACALVSAAFLLVRRAGSVERRAAAIAGVIAVSTLALPLVGALVGKDYFIHKNVIPVVPLLALVAAAGLGCRRAGRLGPTGATVLAVAGISLTVMSLAVPSMRRPDVRQVSRELGPPMRDRVLMFVPRWRVLLEGYQGRLEDLRERRVAEVDVFTTGRSVPPVDLPQGFRLARVEPGNTFTLFSFRSRTPRRVTPASLGHHLFSESGLQPIAVVQKGPVTGAS